MNDGSDGHRMASLSSPTATRWRQALAGLVLAGSVAFTAAWTAFPWVLRYPLMQGESLVQWRWAWVQWAWPVLALACLVVALGGWWSLRRLGRGLPPVSARWVHVSAPCALAPALVGWSQASPWLGATVAGLALPLGVPFLVAVVVERAVGPLHCGHSVAQDEQRGGAWHSGVRWVGAYAAFLLLFGLAFNGRVGEDIGDEAHYLTQLTSLLQDGDLAIGNNLPEPLPPPGQKRGAALVSSHLIENERGLCYSYHSFGLPLLAWPFGWLGFFGRQLFLALIGAASLAGCWAICAAAGAPRKAAAVAVASLGFSYVWVVYSVRFLPEILGCGLLTWAFWAMLAQSRRPWRSMAVALLCCGYLPYAHSRFVFPSLVIAFFYGLRGLLVPERWRSKLLRLGLFAAGYAAFGLVLMQCQAHMYGTGGAYSSYFGDVLWSYPLAMWAVVVDERGLLSLLPVFALYGVAGIVAVFRASPERRNAWIAGLTLATVLVTSCSNTAALAGQCVPGRYLLTAVPLLLPAVALTLAGAGIAGRVWFHFLSMASVVLLAFTALLIGRPGPSFILPYRRLIRFEGFHALWSPFASFRSPAHPMDPYWTTAFVLGLVLATLVVLFPCRRRLLAGGVALGLLAALLGGWRVHASGQNARLTSTVLLDRNLFPRTFSRLPSRAPARDFFEAFGTWQHLGRRPPQLFTNRDLGTLTTGSTWSLPRLPVNDWRGREFRWHPLHAPIRRKGSGGLVIQAVGIVEGDVRATFAIRHGAYTLEDGAVSVTSGPFVVTWRVPVRRGRGDVLPLVRLEGPEGTVRLKRVLVAPHSPSLMDGGNFTLAGDARTVDAEGRYEP